MALCGQTCFHSGHLPTHPSSIRQQRQQQREYIDVPLPKSIVKAAAAAASGGDGNVGAGSTPFVLKYNACQPVNNL